MLFQSSLFTLLSSTATKKWYIIIDYTTITTHVCVCKKNYVLWQGKTNKNQINRENNVVVSRYKAVIKKWLNAKNKVNSMCWRKQMIFYVRVRVPNWWMTCIYFTKRKSFKLTNDPFRCFIKVKDRRSSRTKKSLRMIKLLLLSKTSQVQLL